MVLTHQSLKFVIVLVVWMSHLTIQGQQQMDVEHTIQQIETQATALDAVAYSPNGTRIAVGGRDNTIRVYDTSSGELLMETEGHADWITSLIFTTSSETIIAGSRDKSIREFDAESGALLRVIGNHNTAIQSIAISPDGTLLASVGRVSPLHGTIKLWHLDTYTLLDEFLTFRVPIWQMAFDPTGTYLAASAEDGRIFLYTITDTGSDAISAHNSPVTQISFSDDGRQLISGSLAGEIKVWDMRDPLSAPLITLPSAHQSSITGLSFLENTQYAVSSSLDGTVKLWDLASAQELRVLATSDVAFTNLAFHHAQAQVTVTDSEGRLTLLNGNTTALINTLEPIHLTRNQSPQYIPSANGQRVILPTIDLSTEMTTFPIEDGTWQIDPWEPLAGHLWGTAWLEMTGNIVIGGHSEMPNGNAGIFYDLYGVGVGDTIILQDDDIIRRYTVVNIRSVDYRDLSVVRSTAFNRLTLITCDIPSWAVEQNMYYERLVIIADEIP